MNREIKVEFNSAPHQNAQCDKLEEKNNNSSSKNLQQIRACRKAFQLPLPFEMIYSTVSSAVNINTSHRFIFVKDDFQVCLTVQFYTDDKFCTIRMYPTKYNKADSLIFNIKPMPLFNLDACIDNKDCEIFCFRNKHRLINKLVINFSKTDFLAFASPYKKTGSIPLLVRLQHFVEIKRDTKKSRLLSSIEKAARN
jgi:hypothetical protein